MWLGQSSGQVGQSLVILCGHRDTSTGWDIFSLVKTQRTRATLGGFQSYLILVRLLYVEAHSQYGFQWLGLHVSVREREREREREHAYIVADAICSVESCVVCVCVCVCCAAVRLRTSYNCRLL